MFEKEHNRTGNDNHSVDIILNLPYTLNENDKYPSK